MVVIVDIIWKCLDHGICIYNFPQNPHTRAFHPFPPPPKEFLQNNNLTPIFLAAHSDSMEKAHIFFMGRLPASFPKLPWFQLLREHLPNTNTVPCIDQNLGQK